MNFIKRYLPSVLFGLLLLNAFPFFLFIIFILGDSCCGENTNASMLQITLVIMALYLIPSWFLNFIANKIQTERKKIYPFRWGIAISWIISTSLYWFIIIGFFREGFS